MMSVTQDMVLMRALRDMNLPKFVFEDVPLFLGLIGDLFPGLDCPRVRYPKFNDAVEAVLVDKKYILLPHQVSTFYHSLVPRPHPSLLEGEGLVKNGNIPGPEAGIWESQSDCSICNQRIPYDHRARRVSISPACLS